MTSSVEPLRHSRFRLLWMASVVSNVGSFLQTVAAGWLMLELTHSALWVGLLPVGSIVGGALGDVIGAPGAVVVLSIGAVAVGSVALRVGVPALGEVVASDPPPDWNVAPHDFHMSGGPVMVLTTWVIRHAELPEFLDVVDRLRLVRLRTGAYRWRLYRSAEDPHRMTEVMVLSSWRDHIRQHQRIDAEAVAVIQAAAAFDREGGLTTRHLVAVEVADRMARPSWDELLAVHRDLHDTDGSIPLSD